MEASGLERKRKRKRSNKEQTRLIRQLNSGDEAEGEDGTSKLSPTSTGTLRPPLDEEVEEFFAILRRAHNAVKYFGKNAHGNGDGYGDRSLTASETGLPSRSLNGDEGRVKRVEKMKAEKGVSFDLNVVPEGNGDRV